jgi:hypothetical protein
MTDNVDYDLEVIRNLPEFRRNRLILRVESEGTESTDWHYRASYPELQDFAVTGPDVLSTILELETKLDHYLDRDDA